MDAKSTSDEIAEFLVTKKVSAIPRITTSNIKELQGFKAFAIVNGN